MILKPFQHVLPTVAEVYSLVVVAVLGMVELKVDFHSRGIFDSDQFEVVKAHWLKIQVTPRLIDSFLVSLFEKFFPIHLYFFRGIIKENPDVLAPTHLIVVIVVRLSKYLVVL